ncbi:TetR/AcrR family transcriptional regulator C-terminal domain-containing protein [Streptomyces sp. SBR177]
MLVRHPWMSAVAGQYLNIGPNAIAAGVKIQAAIRDTGLPVARQPSAMAAVFQFVYGYGTIEGQFHRVAQQAGMSQDDYYTASLKAFRDDEKIMGALEEMTEILTERQTHGTVSQIWDRDFEYALDVLVAGIEVMVERSRTEQPEEPGETGSPAGPGSPGSRRRPGTAPTHDGAAGRPLPAAPYSARPRLRSKRGRESSHWSAATFWSASTLLLFSATSLMNSVTRKAISANGAE